jgi:PPOX class probable F420-dependent enzyme
MTRDEALRRVAAARVARMATVRPDGSPHVVPFVFALVASDPGVRIYWAVDDKPKRSARLARIEHLRTNPAVEIVVDAYDDDWSRLWWVRVRGAGRIVRTEAERGAALAALTDKYAAYRDSPPRGDVVAIDVAEVRWWSAAANA